MAKNGKASRGRKSRKTKDKADEPEMRKASLDLQPVELKSDDFALHLRSTKSAVERMKSAKNLYDGCCKAAKKVSEDLLNAVKRALKFEGMDAADIKRQLEIDGYVLRKTGSYVQLTIHDTLLGDENEMAYKRGHDAGANGKTLANPYPENSDLAEQYNTGWRNAVGGNLGLSMEEVADAVGDGIQDAIDKSGIGHNSAQAAE